MADDETTTFDELLIDLVRALVEELSLHRTDDGAWHADDYGYELDLTETQRATLGMVFPDGR